MDELKKLLENAGINEAKLDWVSEASTKYDIHLGVQGSHEWLQIQHKGTNDIVASFESFDDMVDKAISISGTQR